MAGSKSTYLAKNMVDHVLGSNSYTKPTNVYIALYTVAPTAAGGGTEATGGVYARSTVANNTTNWVASTNGNKSNATSVTFLEQTTLLGTIVAFGIFDALTAGNLLYFGTLNTNKIIDIGDTPIFQVGDIAITES